MNDYANIIVSIEPISQVYIRELQAFKTCLSVKF